MSQFLASGGQSIGASASVLPMNIQDWFPLGLTWFDLLAVQGTLKSLLQHHSSKGSILWYSVFFMVQLSYPYMTTGNTIALIRWTFVSKVISLLFNTLSRFVIAFLPKKKRLLMSWLQLLSAVILEPKKRKSVTASTFFPSLCHEGIEPDAMISVFFMWGFNTQGSSPHKACLSCYCSLSSGFVSKGWEDICLAQGPPNLGVWHAASDCLISPMTGAFSDRSASDEYPTPATWHSSITSAGSPHLCPAQLCTGL